MNNQIEKKASEFARKHKIEFCDYDGNPWSSEDDLNYAFRAGAAAVIELIRERMPGKSTYDGILQYKQGIADGHDALRSEILELLDTIK